MLFHDRADAGQRLGVQLREFAQRELPPEARVLVLGLPRGGVPVAFEVAREMDAPLDVLVVRKLGVPGHEELAMGAIASGSVRVINDKVVHALEITSAQIEEATTRERRELERREHAYRAACAPLDARGQNVFLIDDGLATGYTMRAAVAALRQAQPKRVIMAVPVAARSICEELEAEADAAICLFTPPEFSAVGQWYESFVQTTDDEVREWLDRARSSARNSARKGDRHAA